MTGLKSHAEALSELGLSGAVPDADIRAAFRRRLKQAHPDLNGGTDMRLRRLLRARELLMSDPKNKREAFEFIHAVSVNTLTPLFITLHQALFGGTVVTQVPALEFAPADEPLTSLTQTKTLRISLPCGLRDGEKVRLACAGAADRERLFHIHIEPETDCRVWGDDIWMTAPLESRLLRRGGAAVIDTPRGAQKINIDRDTPHGAGLRLKGLGLPATPMAQAGDLHVRLEAAPDTLRPAGHVLNDFRQRWAS